MATIRIRYSGLVDALTHIIGDGGPNENWSDLKREESGAIARTLAMLLTNGYDTSWGGAYYETFLMIKTLCEAPDANPGTIALQLITQYGNGAE